MRIYLFLAAIIIAVCKAAELREVDLEPNDAQNFIEQQDQSLNYAPKIDSNVPAVRFLGPEAHNVLEDIYLAKQYHGQDGLGGYLYGYQVPDIAKNEKKEASGDLKGAYNYVLGNGQEIRVEYWDNGQGFNQKDNTAEVLPQQVEDSPEVKQAKEEFFKRWHEEAERNTHPIEDPNNVPAQSEVQYKVAKTESTEEGTYVAGDEGKYVPQPGEDGPPKGFFYRFDYPVGIIVQDQGRALPTNKQNH